ncbi:hypothetical protein [Plantactinospora sp. KLBMP9567]|uniref:hypothetical protein n=1 Tax=Plantactinospora sp. KLBMP9567 TaxID=3085900 RepID=UPI0029810EAC|nr:hypothetical protein [Plantactinospora sp. KLBMP9567]MDW5329533.1 hypothetical protein [Plantactinospora sp. KLBMP9567]
MTDTARHRLRHALVRANRQIRHGRELLPESTNLLVRSYPTWVGETMRPVKMYQIWFRTRGCTFDRAGQCSMCNYGVGPEIDPDVIADAVAARLALIPKRSFVYLSPSGSFFDDREVPPVLRERLLASLAERAPEHFAFETRPETCAPEMLGQVRRALPETELICQIGVESWDEQIRTLCHLKPTPQESLHRALAELGRHDYRTIANLTLGGLGLSHREAYRDALSGVAGSRAAGFTTQMVFPLSAKAGTLLGWVHAQGMWEPPSLWMLIRLLVEDARRNGGPDDRFDLHISWFNPSIGDVVQARPGCCDICRPLVVEALATIQSTPDRRVLDDLLRYDRCACPQLAEQKLAHDDGRTYLDRLTEVMERWEASRPGELHLLPS